MSRIETHGLPKDLDCESYVLGAVLKRYELYWPQVADLLTAQDFSIDTHRIIWQRVQDLIAHGIAVDRVTVFKALAERGEVESVGGITYLIGLDDNMPEVPNVSAYAQRVREKSTLRQGIIACQAIIERLAAPGAGPEDIVAAEAAIKRVSETTAKKRRLVSIGEVIQGGVDGNGATSFVEASERSEGVQGPWPWLNRMTGGFRGGNLVILAARPSVGKTSAAAQFMLHAITSGIGGVFVTLEMPKRDIVRKLVAAHAGVSLSEWQNGELDAAGRRAVMRSSQALRQAEAFLDDEPRATVPGIHAAILRHQAEHDVRFVVIDYLQLLTPAGRGHNRTEDVSEITRGLKLMAMELDVPVIALSQLSRASAKDSREPRLHDLRDSGSIEQDADIVLFLHRVEKPFVNLILAKQRLGPIGDVRLVFDRTTALFSEIEGGGYDEAYQ